MSSTAREQSWFWQAVPRRFTWSASIWQRFLLSAIYLLISLEMLHPCLNGIWLFLLSHPNHADDFTSFLNFLTGFRAMHIFFSHFCLLFPTRFVGGSFPSSSLCCVGCSALITTWASFLCFCLFEILEGFFLTWRRQARSSWQSPSVFFYGGFFACSC